MTRADGYQVEPPLWGNLVATLSIRQQGIRRIVVGLRMLSVLRSNKECVVVSGFVSPISEKLP